MVSNKELRELVEAARAKGAIIRCRCEGGDGTGTLQGQVIVGVQVRYGTIPGVGDGWMPPIQSAERLREFLAVEVA